MIEIFFLQRRAARHLPEVTVRLDRQLAGLQDQLFDLRLQRIAQLEAFARKQLDAVVLIRIVRRGDNRARVRVQLNRQKMCIRDRTMTAL